MSVPGQRPRPSPVVVAADPVVLEQPLTSSPLDSTQVLLFMAAQAAQVADTSFDSIKVCAGAPATQDTVLHPDQPLPVSRPASASSSLDPYYFGLQSPADSPVPLPSPFLQSATTPDQPLINEPITPARNPANIDRRGLVGVGELATPRWTRNERTSDTDESDLQPRFDVTAENSLPDFPDNVHDDEPDSPWTIEAVDGEISDKEEVCSPFTTLSFAHSVLKGSSPAIQGPPESSLSR